MTIAGFNITGYQLAFIAIAGITVLASLLVVLLPNILKSALFLALALLSTAGLYVLLNAPLLAAVQVMVYVGGIATMIVLAIFLTHRFMKVKLFDAIYNPLLGAGVAALTFLFLFLTVANSVWIGKASAAGPAESGANIPGVADALLQTYVFPFELITLVLIAVLIGAVVLAKEDRGDSDVT